MENITNCSIIKEFIKNQIRQILLCQKIFSFILQSNLGITARVPSFLHFGETPNISTALMQTGPEMGFKLIGTETGTQDPPLPILSLSKQYLHKWIFAKYIGYSMSPRSV